MLQSKLAKGTSVIAIRTGAKQKNMESKPAEENFNRKNLSES